jgi:hypothetical protein
MIGTTGRALPMRVGIGAGRQTQGIPLRKATSLGVASFLFFDFRKKQVDTTLIEPLGADSFDLVPRLRNQAGIKRRSGQEQPAFRIGLIALCQ